MEIFPPKIIERLSQFRSSRGFNLPNLVLILTAVFVSAAVFSPGLTGPYVFDDFQNITQNQFLKMDALTMDSILSAALSSDSGPLKRPLPMISFALNTFFSGNEPSPYVFKATNLAIHALNGALVFWFVNLLLGCHVAASEKLPSDNRVINRQNAKWLAALAAILWVSHPIQLTSVLYIVQRMTSLSATFALVAMIFYLSGRFTQLKTNRFPVVYLIYLPSLFVLLSVFSKETGVLIPLYILVIEYTIFGNSPLHMLSKIENGKLKNAVFVSSVLLSLLAAVVVFMYANNGYAHRDFNMLERVLTEARVISRYVYLILVPSINNFALYHDYLDISVSLFTPWTTAPAILFLGVLIATAFVSRRIYPLLSFGVFWFLAGHSLESSIFALEIAHEHRNYLPSLGIIILLVYLIALLARDQKNRKIYFLFPALVAINLTVSHLRSEQWSGSVSLHESEVRHHPDSARAQTDYATLLASIGRFDEAIGSVRTASKLNPLEPAYPIYIMHLQSLSRSPIDTDQQGEILKLLSEAPLTSFLRIELGAIDTCITGRCKSIHKLYLQWLQALVERKSRRGDVAYFNYLLGKYHFQHNNPDKSIYYLTSAYSLDNKYVHPLFLLASIYTRNGQYDETRKIIDLIRETSDAHNFDWNTEILELENEMNNKEGGSMKNRFDDSTGGRSGNPLRR